MAQAKYKEYFQKMVAQNQDLFAEFSQVHELFVKDQQNHEYEEDFHRVGQRVVDVIRDWDRRLCSAMGRGVFSQYSQTLSEKFWSEAEKKFSLIYSVGVKKS